MPRYRIVFDDGRNDVLDDIIDDKAAADYALELLLDDGAEEGEEATVYRLAGERGAEEYVQTVTAGDCDG